MQSNAEIAVIGKLANPPERRGRNGETAALHLLVDGLGKENGEAKAAWCRVTCFGELATTVLATFDRGDSIYARGRPTLDRWKDNITGAEKSGLSMIATEITRLGVEMKAPVRSEIPTAMGTRDPAKTAAKAVKPSAPRRGGKSFNAIRIKREDRTDWQRPLDWVASSDCMDDLYPR